MSLYDYKKSREILVTNPTFKALIMAAMTKTNTSSVFKLRKTFPKIFNEMQKRRQNLIGILDGDRFTLEIDGKKYQKIFKDLMKEEPK